MSMINKFITFSAISMLFLCILASDNAYCKDLGVYGQTYPVQENDLLDFILKRVKTMQSNGEWSQLQKQFNQNVAHHADRPHPVEFVERATKDTSWNYDPTITVPYDLTNENGRVFAKAGQKINPLHIIKLHSSLVFINSDDEKQVTWIQNYLLIRKQKIKFILVKGSISEIEKKFKTHIYFDQEGKLTNRFHIQHVPAIVQQDGDTLKISEVAL
jgi:conjugal transfer pilus assembly protein TraW